jgi:hypothetical protein
MKSVTLKYEPDKILLEMERYLQRIMDEDEAAPSIYGFCARRLNMRVADIVIAAQSNAEIGDLLAMILAQCEAYITDAMMSGDIDIKAGQHMLRQPVFGWRDRSMEAISVKTEMSYDEDTRNAIIAASSSEEIMDLYRKAQMTR